MGCCTSNQQAMPDSTTTSERPQPKTTSQYDRGSESDSDSYGHDQTQETDMDDGEDEPSRSLTIDSKQTILNGFRDAVERGNDSLCAHFVQEYPSLNLLHTQFENGDSPLHVAVRNKSYRLILYLLDNDVSPNQQNPKNGETPLHTAARVREVKCAALLFKYEADVDITNNQHETALTIAAENKDEDIIELLSPATQQLISQHITRNSQEYDSDDPDNVPDLENMTTSRLDTEMDDILSGDDSTARSKKRRANKNMESVPESDTVRSAGSADASLLLDERSLEQKLDDQQLLKLKTIKIARTNPFSKLQKRNTQKALVALQNVTTAAGSLPALEAWLEKKKPRPPYSWTKRWVMVKGTHFLWSDKQRTIRNPKDAKERAKFQGSLSLMMITSVEPVVKKSKSQRKFIVTARQGSTSKSKEYVFRAASKTDRDFWVTSLNVHINHVKSLVSYLGTKQF